MPRAPKQRHAAAAPLRTRLPRLKDRLVLGSTGLRVSPFCLGVVGRPGIIGAAYQAGINFFFLTADMHWPVYEPVRKGLRQLLQASPEVRAKIVVAVVSYVTQPEFSWAPFDEVLEAVPELGHVDVAVIGGSYPGDFLGRHKQYLLKRPGGMKALGASFHDRTTAVTAVNHGLVDVAFVRYNPLHPGAEADVFPQIQAERSGRLFSFQSTHAYLKPERLAALGLPEGKWRPAITDYYRFALRQPKLDGVLCSFDREEHVAELGRALVKGALSEEQASYLKNLSALDAGAIELTKA
jgi:aryl-alcohol dehydrogenase-like predicted oxidoreductase